MLTQNIYLSEDEQKAIVLLSQRYTYNELPMHCRIPLSGMNFFLAEIRRKTGIRDTKYHKECKDYLTAVAATLEKESPSRDQIWAMRLYLEESTIEAMARELKISQDEVLPFLDSACRAVAIFTRDERARKMQVRQYLTSMHPADDVILTPARMHILRGIAAGHPMPQIADEIQKPLKWTQQTARDIVRGLGLSTRGRDVQRTLVRTFLRVRDTERPSITMDDPLF
jgi:hypothetical protein